MNTPEFVALGYCSNDHLCRIPEIPGDGKIEMTEYRIQGGGPAGDAAVGAARLGSSAAFVTSVGDDMDGRLILADFAAEKVDTSAIRVRRAAAAGRLLLDHARTADAASPGPKTTLSS